MSGDLRVEIETALAHFCLKCHFDARPEVVVLFGASGAGKSSVLECIAGFRTPERGEIALGERILFSSAQGVDIPAHRRRVGYLSQQSALFPHLSVRENVEYGLLDQPRAERELRVEAILERFKIASLARRRPAAISGGEQQRVALARTLVCESEVLLLDEPLSALDEALKSLLLETIFDWQRERAVPMLYVTHEQSEAYLLSRRVLVLEAGKVIADGAPREVFNTPVRREQASLAGYENIFDAVLEALHPEMGTMTCRLGGSGLLMEAPVANRLAGEAVCLAMRAGDILVATERPSGISARNIVPGRVEVIEDRAGMVELRVLCGAGAATAFVVHITRGAREALDLHHGKSVWLIIKTHSIQFLRG